MAWGLTKMWLSRIEALFGRAEIAAMALGSSHSLLIDRDGQPYSCGENNKVIIIHTSPGTLSIHLVCCFILLYSLAPNGQKSVDCILTWTLLRLYGIFAWHFCLLQLSILLYIIAEVSYKQEWNPCSRDCGECCWLSLLASDPDLQKMKGHRFFGMHLMVCSDYNFELPYWPSLVRQYKFCCNGLVDQSAYKCRKVTAYHAITSPWCISMSLSIACRVSAEMRPASIWSRLWNK